MPRVCFEEKPQINTFYDDVEVCKRGGKKKKGKKPKATISNVNKVIVNLTQGNRRRMTAPTRTFANPPKALQSITYSNPVAPSHFSNAPAQTHTPMKIFKDTVEEKVRDSIPTFRALENPNGLCPADTNARRAIPSRIPSGGVLSSAPVVQLAQQTLDKARDVMQRMGPSYFPPTGSASNLPKPYPAQEEIARPSNFVPLVAAQPEPREVQQQRIQASYKIRTPIEGDISSRYKNIFLEKSIPGGKEPFVIRGKQAILREHIPKDKIPESKEEKEASKKRGGSVF
jgi:hypothetical protein